MLYFSDGDNILTTKMLSLFIEVIKYGTDECKTISPGLIGRSIFIFTIIIRKLKSS